VAATVAATMALSAGVALARAERRRRQRHRQRLQRRLGLAPGEPLADGLQRMALGQLDIAIELLSGEGGDDTKAIHDTRKALKRLRALLMLIEHRLPKKAFKGHDQTLRTIAGRLAGARDAQVMLATLDSLIAANPRKLGRRGSVRRLRRRLLTEHTRLQRLTLGAPSTRAAVLGELHQLRAGVLAWELPHRKGIELVERDLRRVYRDGRKRYRRVLRGKGEQTVAMHRWRKRVKDLRYAIEMLDRRHSPHSLHRIASRADSLGELLGEDHDLAVFAERLREGSRAHDSHPWRTKRKTRRLLLKAVAKRRLTLRKQALRQGAKLYSRSPKRFLGRVRKLS
jgi:CHAD domain-containing protein